MLTRRDGAAVLLILLCHTIGSTSRVVNPPDASPHRTAQSAPPKPDPQQPDTPPLDLGQTDSPDPPHADPVETEPCVPKCKYHPKPCARCTRKTTVAGQQVRRTNAARRVGKDEIQPTACVICCYRVDRPRFGRSTCRLRSRPVTLFFSTTHSRQCASLCHSPWQLHSSPPASLSEFTKLRNNMFLFHASNL
eukprot:SAG31_NODE_248_length_19104_cov_3.721019_11_plen_192_part_00